MIKKIVPQISFLAFLIIITACTNAVPVSTRIFEPKLGLTVSTKQNLVMAGGTAVSGSNKIKFSMGYNAGAAGMSQIAVTSGPYKIRASATGEIREE